MYFIWLTYTHAHKTFISKLCTIPTEAIDEAPQKLGTLNFGKEMSQVHFYLKESLSQMKGKFPNDQDILSDLTNLLFKLDRALKDALAKSKEVFT